MLTCSKWSRMLFSKVFGAVFLLSTSAWASREQQALDAARRALLIQSGIQKKVQDFRQFYSNKVKSSVVSTLKEYDALEEAAVIGGILQIIRERGLSIKYEGVDYIITPSQVKVIIYL